MEYVTRVQILDVVISFTARTLMRKKNRDYTLIPI